MFCGNCGKQNPDDGRFCTNCGCELNGSTASAQAESVGNTVHETPTAAPKKKKTGIAKKLIIAAVAFVVAFVCSYVAASWENSLPDVEPSSGAPSSAYSNIFWNYGPGTPESDFAGQGLNTASYAIHLGDNMIENLEYVYEDGVVLTMVDSIYVPVYGLDDAARAELNSMMQSNLETYTDLSFCKLSSYEFNGYYVYKLILTDLDEKENVRQLSGTGMIVMPEDGSQADRIAIKFTEESLLAGGYSKR